MFCIGFILKVWGGKQQRHGFSSVCSEPRGAKVQDDKGEHKKASWRCQPFQAERVADIKAQRLAVIFTDMAKHL